MAIWTLHAENIGVMAATGISSTAPYYVAAVVAILLGLSPKVGEVVAAIPEGVLGGVTRCCTSSSPCSADASGWSRGWTSATG